MNTPHPNTMKLDRKKVLELGKVNDERVLDIGAGDLTIIAAERFNCQVTSIDVNESVLDDERERTKRKGLTDKIQLEKEDATDLTYQNEAFETVISYGALHHNSKNRREAFIREAVRVAENKVLFTEFKEEHHIHLEDIHPPVDHESLHDKLGGYGRVEVHEGEEKLLYMLKKGDPLT